jgi:hypothetical protein
MRGAAASQQPSSPDRDRALSRQLASSARLHHLFERVDILPPSFPGHADCLEDVLSTLSLFS